MTVHGFQSQQNQIKYSFLNGIAVLLLYSWFQGFFTKNFKMEQGT